LFFGELHDWILKVSVGMVQKEMCVAAVQKGSARGHWCMKVGMGDAVLNPTLTHSRTYHLHVLHISYVIQRPLPTDALICHFTHPLHFAILLAKPTAGHWPIRHFVFNFNLPYLLSCQDLTLPPYGISFLNSICHTYCFSSQSDPILASLAVWHFIFQKQIAISRQLQLTPIWHRVFPREKTDQSKQDRSGIKFSCLRSPRLPCH